MSLSSPPTNTELCTKSKYNPRSWKCQGYEPDGYIYYDCAENSPDSRCLIDLQTSSMERLRDVRPYLYYVGYWHDPLASFPPPVVGDAAVEDYYVEAGRHYLQAEWDLGHGYFAALDHVWPAWKIGSLYSTMPWEWCAQEEFPGDVGFDLLSRSDPNLLIKSVLKTNLRIPLPDEEVLTEKAHDDWDIYIQSLYGVHPIEKICCEGTSLADCQHEIAIEGWSDGYVIEEACYLYPNYHASPQMPPMRPARARKFIEGMEKAYDMNRPVIR